MLDPCLSKWGVLWRSKTKLEGLREHLMWEEEGKLVLTNTRREARQYIQAHYGYILLRRPDLRGEPHGWRLPRPVKVVGIVWER